ncbi:MAG: type II toxin-antitoxin system RelE/ParE family toxin [Candidatus Poribacteria bacterium]|nr:type II toxin-antitoxin system RelE/ParE family toxin [Candidatus Poribacteria bacterium]
MRSVSWVGDAKERLLEFPNDVQSKVGYLLQLVQEGKTSNKIKRLRGFPGVYEIVSTYARNTYRAVYAVNLNNRIYVLHCFQKKSTFGIKTPKKEIDLIRRRLSMAKELARREDER